MEIMSRIAIVHTHDEGTWDNSWSSLAVAKTMVPESEAETAEEFAEEFSAYWLDKTTNLHYQVITDAASAREAVNAFAELNHHRAARRSAFYAREFELDAASAQSAGS